MHAPVWKNTTLNQIVGLTLILGLVTSVALNVALFSHFGDHAARVGDAPAAPAQSASMARFADAKQHQIDVAQAAISPRTTLDPRMLRFYARKESKLDEMYSALGQSHQRSALTPSQQRYVDLKSDQLDGIVAGR